MRATLLTICILLSINIVAQKKDVTIEDLQQNGTFRPKSVSGLRSTSDGSYYTKLEDDNTKVVKYSYSTGKAVATLVDLSDIDDCPISKIQNYELSKDEQKVLIYTDREKIYRHSFKANYYVYDAKVNEITAVDEEGKQQIASLSPNGEMVAYMKDNNLYINKLKFGTTSVVTKDGEFNKIINGAPDWVYEEEFSYNKAYEWSPDSKELAFVKFDESKVKEYSFQEYNASNPESDSYSTYPSSYKYKYPKAGEVNSKVSVNVFNVKSRKITTMKIDSVGDYYVPRIKWTNTPGMLGVVKLNRRQDQLELILANSSSSVCRTIFTDRNDRYVDESVLDNISFLDDGKYFVYVGEMDGYMHIYLYNMSGIKVAQITKGDWDVTKFYGYDEAKKLFFYQAAKESPLQREVYYTSLDGKKQAKLSSKVGTNSAVFSTGCKYFINYFSSTTTPTHITMHNQAGKLLRTLEDNDELNEMVNTEYNISGKEFFTFKSDEGIELNGWVVKPSNFDPNKEYPLLMTQYSGPNSQSVTDSWGIGWEQYLASKGIVVACVDPRGTGARGEEFKKCTYLNLGKLETEDQISAAKYLGSQSYIDANRIAIWGWSYGGFMVCSALSKGEGVFKLGVAIAPVTNWRFYDSVYTERYMRKPQENAKGYDSNSPLNMAKDLSGRLFLIHGTADDNVHYQNTLEYVNKLVEANKQFDVFIYPNQNHSIYFGKNTRIHLYNMVSQYLLNNL